VLHTIEAALSVLSFCMLRQYAEGTPDHELGELMGRAAEFIGFAALLSGLLASLFN
jgi:hypothetical protein